ncbi:hypothetical protein MTO96_036989 [Rhipicephalus appendiculatus]
MDEFPVERDQLLLSALAEKGDSIAVTDRGEVYCCRPPCTAYNHQACPINNCLANCNEFLFASGLELSVQRGGSLSLASIHGDQTPHPEPESHRQRPYLRWLLKTHACITTLELSDDTDRSHSKIVLQELPDNSRIKNLTLNLFGGHNAHNHLATHLPRLRSLEVLSCYFDYDCRDAVTAVSALLRTTKLLTCLVVHWSCECRQPPRMLIDALAANSTLKWLDLVTAWETTEPPGPLGEYVMSNGLLTSLTVDGHDVDREKLLLEEALLRNDTLSTLRVLSLCGGERSARFITRILAQCSTLEKLDVGWARTPYTMISEDTLTHCAEALSQNQTLEELTLPYCLWHPSNWIAFFALLPRNKHLKKLDITSYEYTEDYPTFPPVLEAWAQTSPSAHVSFGHYIHGLGVNLMHYSVFSGITLSGEESMQIDALGRLPALDYFTSLTINVFEASEPLFSALAKYIRETTTLRKLSLFVTNPRAPDNTANLMCWTLLFESMSANTSVSDLDIFSNGYFQYNDRLTHTIANSRHISRVSFLENTGFGDATDFVSLLSETIADNYVLLKVDLHGAKVGGQAKRCLFTIRQTTQRNCGLLERAAAFNQAARLDWHTAAAFEKVARSPALIRELAEEEGIPTAEVARMLRSRLRSVEGLHDFMRLTGVVKESVKCAPPVEGCGMQLPDLNDDCWRLVRRYLSFDDVKRFTIAKPCHLTSS